MLELKKLTPGKSRHVSFITMSLMPVVALSRDSNPLKMPSSSIQGLKVGDFMQLKNAMGTMGSEHKTSYELNQAGM